MQSKISALGRKLRGRATLQFKFSLSYILVIAAVLILLNSYPLLVSQNLMVSSTQANLRSTAKVIESALMGLEQLTEENVSAALSGLNEAAPPASWSQTAPALWCTTPARETMPWGSTPCTP